MSTLHDVNETHMISCSGSKTARFAGSWRQLGLDHPQLRQYLRGWLFPLSAVVLLGYEVRAARRIG